MAGPDPLASNHRVTLTEEHQKRLDMLIHRLTSPPVMAFPDLTKPFVLHTYASQEGMGAVLYQEQDGKLRVLEYASRTLTPSEKNYHMHAGKLEFLALKWAVTESFVTTCSTPPPSLSTLTTIHLRTYYHQPSCPQWGIGGWQNWQILILISSIGLVNPTSTRICYPACH